MRHCDSDHGGTKLKRCPDCPILIHLPTVQHDRGIFLPTVAYRTYFGLTQTCRIIRNEFRSLYLSTAEVVVPLDMLKRCNRAFIEDVDYIYSLSDIVRVTGPTCRLRYGGVDVLPFLREVWAYDDEQIFLDTTSVLPADNALLLTLNKLLADIYAFIRPVRRICYSDTNT